jgi:hypothetical protein
MKQIIETARDGKQTQAAPMLSVYEGRACIGFIITRGKLGFQAFSADLVSLGTFPTQREAADAISEARR